MTIKSETMRRMDAMKSAGLQPDMLVAVDTMAVRNGQMVMIRNPHWLALYNDNLHVRAAYDADVDLSGFFDQAPTITPHVTPAPAPLVSSFKREEAIDVTPKETFKDITPVPKTPIAPPSENVLVTGARRMAEYFRTSLATREADIDFQPEDGEIAWLFDQLANAVERKENEHGDKQQT